MVGSEPRDKRLPVLLLARQLHIGGSERQLCEMALALDPGRFRVHAGFLRPGGIRAKEIEAAGIPLAEFPLRSFRSPANVWTSIRKLRRYVVQNGIKIVHAFDAPASVFVGIAAPFVRSAVVLTSQRSSRELPGTAPRMGLRLADKLVDGVVVNCEAVRRQLVSDERVADGRIHLCYNGLDARRFQRQAALSDRVPPGALVIGTVCALRLEKGLPTLVQAFAACLSTNPNLFLVFVGDGPELATLQRQIRDAEIFSRCLFQPTVADVVPWLSLIDVFVLPSLSEALSNSLMEAMACGCACVASRVGGNPELVRHGETGLLFGPEDVPDLTAQLERVIVDQPLRARLGRNAVSLINERFSLTAAAARLGGIYDAMMAARQATR